MSDWIKMEEAQAAVLPIIEHALEAIDGMPDRLPDTIDPAIRNLVVALAGAARTQFLEHLTAAAITLQALEKASKNGK